jgi:hypothetical protein
MANSSDFPLSFSTGFVYAKDLVFIASEMDKLAEEDPHTKMLQWDAGTWTHYLIDWPVVALCVIDEPDLKVLGMGMDGRIHVATSDGFDEESVDDSIEGPERRGDLRDMRMIGEHIYVAGMGRQVYRRESSGNWARIDQGTLLPLDSKEIAGFNSIDGFNEQDIYAVGFDGEVWRYHGEAWEKIDSPTALALQRVKCIPPDTVYACGQGGALVRGNGQAWEVIAHQATDANFWGLEWFDGKLYVASSDTVYALVRDKLVPVDMGFASPITCGYLHADDGVMWSIGRKDLAHTDGKAWTEESVI